MEQSMTRTRLRRYFRHGLFPQLMAFEACSRLGSVTRAAEELSLAQPTVSCLLRKLAENVGAPLFDAGNRRFELTRAGREVRGLCHELIAGFDRFDTRLAGRPEPPAAANEEGTRAVTRYHPHLPISPDENAMKLPSRRTLTLEAARVVGAGAEAEAQKNGWKVVIAVVDDGGHLVHLARLDGTQTSSVDTAIGKAQAAMGFRRPTRVLEEMVNNGRTAFVTLDVVAMQGGVPIDLDGELVGAVGVSGVKASDDEIIALAGVEALKRILT
jgi:uncharacterized protein GlcG (DUF336 family)